MKQIITLVILSLLSAVTVSAQDYSRLIINGLKVDDTEYTEADIVAALGKPDSVELGVLGVSFTYYEQNRAKATNSEPCVNNASQRSIEDLKADIVLLSELPAEGPIVAVQISSPEYLINGLVRVGDNIEKAKQMGGEWIPGGDVADDGGHPVYWRPEYLKKAELLNCVEFYCSADGTIESVSIWRY